VDNHRNKAIEHSSQGDYKKEIVLDKSIMDIYTTENMAISNYIGKVLMEH
jgi:hypothetical protein